MKKTIFLLLLLFIPIRVVAQENLNESNQKYRFYYLEKEYSEKFFEKGKNDQKYPKIGQAWYYEDKIHISKNKPAKEKLIVEEIPVLKYQEHQKIRYLIIDQTYSRSKINLTELEVFNKENKIYYEISCDTCSTDFFSKIQNNIVNYEYNYISNNTKIIIDLKKEYFPEDITLKIHIYGVDGKEMKLRLTANNTADLKDTYFRHIIERVETPYLEIVERLKDIEHEERLEENIQEVKGVQEIENGKILERYTEYHYKNKVYQYYREIKHYIDGYYSNLSGLIKDENDFIIEKEEENITVDSTQTGKEQALPKTIVEYIEKEVPIKITEIKKIPITIEKIKQKENIVEIPVDRIVEKNVSTEKPKNYPFQYIVYVLSAVFLKKLSFFNR